MTGLNYYIEEYQIAVGRMSYKKHLIVEGKTDKCFFKILLDEFSKHTCSKFLEDKSNKFNDIEVDDIQTFIGDNKLISLVSGVSGERKKIECIHNNVKSLPQYNNLVFFIDREFDNFTISFEQDIQDKINYHKVDGSLIWSRGHSIENYLFDFNILRQPLRRLSCIELFNDVVQIFENTFHLTLRLASAISLSLRECEKIQVHESIIGWEFWELIDVNTSNINLRIIDWKKRMQERGEKDKRGKTIRKFSDEEIESVVSNYKKWYEKIENDNVDINILRWMCHGHIGSEVILAVYRSFINYYTVRRETSRVNNKINRAGKEDILEEFANWWAYKAVRDECLYPSEVLDKLWTK